MTVADQIRGKTPEEIRKVNLPACSYWLKNSTIINSPFFQHFNIKNDFTEEEMEQIKKENEWCEGN